MDRRLYNPYLDEHKPSSTGQLIVRILLIASAVTALLVPALLFLPGESLFVWYWIYIAVVGLPVILLLVALAVKLHQSIKKKLPRIIATALAAMVALFAATTTYSLCMLYGQIGANPSAYYTNPDTGNRMVIMKAIDLENTDESDWDRAYFYGAYPMRNKFLYYPARGDIVSTRTGIDYVEWTNGGMGAAAAPVDRAPAGSRSVLHGSRAVRHNSDPGRASKCPRPPGRPGPRPCSNTRIAPPGFPARNRQRSRSARPRPARRARPPAPAAGSRSRRPPTADRSPDTRRRAGRVRAAA